MAAHRAGRVHDRAHRDPNRAPGVRHVRARQIDFIGNEASPVQADGDAACRTPVSVTDAPAAIPVVVG